MTLARRSFLSSASTRRPRADGSDHRAREGPLGAAADRDDTVLFRFARLERAVGLDDLAKPHRRDPVRIGLLSSDGRARAPAAW